MRNHFLMSLVWNDFRRNKAVNTVLFLFLFVSALMMASGALVIERLSGALDGIYEVAMPPHYLQMHVGEVDQDAVNAFAAESGLTKATQIQAMVNVEGVNISVEHQDGTEHSLSDSLLDNYFVTQNTAFDHLLDLNNQVVQLEPGEIGVPVVYSRGKNIAVGDRVSVRFGSEEKLLTVTYIIRDAQMGSSLASSIRFLVHDEDFEWFSEHGTRHESIISFMLNTEEDINTFEALYNSEASHMPKNGIGITLPLIRLVNGIGDGLMSGVIVLVSFILIAIALLNIRFTILSTLEDEARSIGTLKAIGLRNKDIFNLYKVKYRLLTVVACLLAAFSSFAVVNSLIKNISLNFGTSDVTVLTYVYPFIAVTAVYLMIMLGLNRILKIISKMTVIDALVEGKIVSTKQKKPKFIHPIRWVGRKVDLSLSLQAFRVNIKSWLLLTFVYCLIVFTILIPLNILMTMDSPEFIKYVGAAKSDVRIAIEYKPALEQTLSSIEEQLKNSDDVKTWHVFKTIRGQLLDEKGPMSFMVESGQYNAFPVEMDEGRLPNGEGEMALSGLNASRLALEIGDTLCVAFDNQPKTYTMVGIYQDITSGGLTAKIAEDITTDITQYSYFINLNKGVPIDTFVDALGVKYKGAKVIAVETLMKQTLGTITDSLRISVVAIFAIAMVIVTLLSVLFMTLRMHKNSAEDAVLLALGYKIQSIRIMYLVQSAIAIVMGVILGAAASLYLGSLAMRILLSIMRFGLTQMDFLIQPFAFVSLGIVVPVATGLFVTWQVTRRVANTSIMTFGNE